MADIVNCQPAMVGEVNSREDLWYIIVAGREIECNITDTNDRHRIWSKVCATVRTMWDGAVGTEKSFLGTNV